MGLAVAATVTYLEQRGTPFNVHQPIWAQIKSIFVVPLEHDQLKMAENNAASKRALLQSLMLQKEMVTFTHTHTHRYRHTHRHTHTYIYVYV